MDILEITDNLNRHPWETARKRIVNRLISTISKKGMNILDVGSGDAYLANAFTREFQDCTAHCVDTSYTTDIIKKVKKSYPDKNLELYPSLGDVKTGKIDVVTLLDVIEHVPDDDGFLEKIIHQPYISDDTFFVITVPAYQSLFSRHDLYLKHYRRYSLKNLKATVSKSNLEIIDSGYFFTTLVIVRFFGRLMERATPNRKREWKNLGTWKGGRLKTRLIESILLIDYKMGRAFKSAGIHLPGLSCYVICKRY